MEQTVCNDDIAVAHELATLAVETALPYAGEAVEHTLKVDGSPLSVGDLAVERVLVEFLRRHDPTTGSSPKRRARSHGARIGGCWIPSTAR
jgi:fructose-1,6-bisphosphatase/inositol monophosphatase family enzyme